MYSEASLQTSSKGLHWYENAPERVPLGTERKKRRGNAQIYHFLLGDPGMCSYSDKVIKQLEPDNIKKMKDWNKKFTASYKDSELETLRQLSLTVDELWENQIKLRQTVEEETQDALAIFGKEDAGEDSHTTIRQKDLIYSKLYKSEHMKNAGPYARLKFAMDYWCALWFWPIDRAELLPSRSEFFNDLNLILVGTVSTGKGQATIGYDQLSLFDNEREDLQLIHKINAMQGTDKTQVDLDSLCMLFPRLALVRQIAEQNHFMHWELEFADLFAEKGGFDLVIGNPPWIKTNWNEMSLLADIQPLFAIKKFTSAQVNTNRDRLLSIDTNRRTYLNDYEEATGMQNFFNASCVYDVLKGVQTNLYKCFLPQAWTFSRIDGVFAFVHPDSIFDDPGAGKMRALLYPKLRHHYQFINEKLLFAEVSDTGIFGLNIYSNAQTRTFDMIANVYAPITIDQCYEDKEGTAPIPEIKDENGNWNTKGHSHRIVIIDETLLKSIATVYDDPQKYKETRLPAIYAEELLDVISCFSKIDIKLADFENEIFMTQFLDETGAQRDGIIKRNTHFVDELSDFVYSGPHISIGNPLFKTPRAICREKADFDRVDLQFVQGDYIQRSNYAVEYANCNARIPTTPWGEKYTEKFRVITRRMLGLNQERTLMSAIIPPKAVHIIGVFGICFKDDKTTVLTSALFNSLPYDFLVRALGRASFLNDSAKRMPYTEEYSEQLICRALLLNCLTNRYKELWKRCFEKSFVNDTWLKTDIRLSDSVFDNLTSEWTEDTPVRSDYARRQLLIEIDVIVSKAIGLSLEQLKTLYRIQFPVLKKYEDDTWYDRNGRIVFTNNRSLVGVGFSRQEWENGIKDAPDGQRFYRVVTDDTMPGGPVEREIEYIAPFVRCDRDNDYEITWRSFEERYGSQ